ncbi:predicted protein, partial [Arabidopsis lyrata subsp. lyrata]
MSQQLKIMTDQCRILSIDHQLGTSVSDSLWPPNSSSSSPSKSSSSSSSSSSGRGEKRSLI